MSEEYHIVDLESYHFEEHEVEEYQKLKNSSDTEQKLWIIKQVVKGNIGIADFIEEEEDTWGSREEASDD